MGYKNTIVKVGLEGCCFGVYGKNSYTMGKDKLHIYDIMIIAYLSADSIIAR